MGKPIFKLIYVSSASKLFSNDELESLMHKSRNKNAHFGITGCLIYSEGNIIQYLEGTKASVDYIYSFIENDKRHKHLQRLCYGSVEQRSFKDWRMALKIIPDFHSSYPSLYQLFEDMMDRNQVDSICEHAKVFFETFLHINQLGINTLHWNVNN